MVCFVLFCFVCKSKSSYVYFLLPRQTPTWNYNKRTTEVTPLHANTHTHTHSLSLSFSSLRTLSLSLTTIHSFSLFHSFCLKYTHTHFLSLSYSLCLKYTHSHTHTLFPFSRISVFLLCWFLSQETYFRSLFSYWRTIFIFRNLQCSLKVNLTCIFKQIFLSYLFVDKVVYVIIEICFIFCLNHHCQVNLRYKRVFVITAKVM